MPNTTRDQTEERRDRDNSGKQTIPPPQRPVPTDSAHLPGGATEMAEVNRALADDTGTGKDRSAKSS